MSFQVIIPARFASNRFPGKVLADIAGQSMLQRVYTQACASHAERVIIATDHPRVQAAAQDFGATVCMTEPAHLSGTDRVAEAARQLQLSSDDVIVNVQCDQPLIEPELIDQAAAQIDSSAAIEMATLAAPITSSASLMDPDVVKVVLDADNRALYFSRAMIPYQRDMLLDDPEQAQPKLGQYLRHIGIYAYSMRFLQQFVSWPSCELEEMEKLEQLRALWHGHGLQVAVVQQANTVSVDKPEDVAKVLARL